MIFFYLHCYVKFQLQVVLPFVICPCISPGTTKEYNNLVLFSQTSKHFFRQRSLHRGQLDGGGVRQDLPHDPRRPDEDVRRHVHGKITSGKLSTLQQQQQLQN